MAKASSPAQQQAFFEREIEKLNAAQREAVEQIEGPVMVLAGPGTGKTHILAARIGRILQRTDTQAHNILCLTFTEAGVHAMRERLLQWVGPESYKVHIYTFHSFCNTVIQDHMEVFGQYDLEPLSDLERIEIIRQLINELPVGHRLRPGSYEAYTYEKHLQDLFRKMKAENWSAEMVEQAADEYLAGLPDRPEFVYQQNRAPHQKGDLKEGKINQEIRKMELLKAGAQQFAHYEQLMRQRRRYDYEDMILWVLQAFREHPMLLRAYQEQYLYFLVDEYQDTNGAQSQILEQLIAYWENPNVFVVGDDDQSIYEFQGARIKNLVDFFDSYRDSMRLVSLTENYRSNQDLLDLANGLIRKNEIRLVNALSEQGVVKGLRASHPHRMEEIGILQAEVYPSREQEWIALVERIQTLHAEGCPWDEMAVIYPTHRQAEPLAFLLERMNVPFQTRRKVNLLDQPLIRQVRWLLEYLQTEYQLPNSGDHLLFKLLHAPFWGFPTGLTTELALRKKHSPDQPYRALKDRSEDSDDPIQQSLQDLFGWIDQWLLEIHQSSLPRMVERVINESGLLHWTMQQPDKDWLLQLLYSLHQFIQQEVSRKPRLELMDLLATFKSLDRNGLSIEVQRADQSTEGVQLVTAHSAKGLEFDHVFLFDCIEDYWGVGRRRGRNAFAIPDTLSFSNVSDPEEARRRLFFVALTRARKAVYCSLAAFDAKGKPLTPSMFLEEVLALQGRVLEEGVVESVKIEAALALQIRQPEKPILKRLPKALVERLLVDFRLSVSAFNQYLRCPLGFLYEYVLRVPSIESEAAVYGTSVHQVLERTFRKMQEDPKQEWPETNWVIAQFERELNRRRGFLSPESYQYRLAMGREQLPPYYAQRKQEWVKESRQEVRILHAEVQGVPLKGVIDKLEFLQPQAVRVVDYKTGKTDAKKVKRPFRGSLGGDYWRQLVFYQLLLAHSNLQHLELLGGRIDYIDRDIETGTFALLDAEINPGDRTWMIDQVVNVYTGIQKQDFYEGCGKPSCVWCQFAKVVHPSESLVNEEREALDDPL